MRITPFAGLTELEPQDPLSTDNSSFQARNPSIIDRYLEVGAVSHRHDDHDPLGNPDAQPSAFASATGGVIPASSVFFIGYTLLDDESGETEISPVVTVSTGPPLDPPSNAPSATVEYTGGSLIAGSYYYGLTLVDADGGETELSDVTSVVREPGFPSGQVQLGGLDTDMIALGAAGWRLWKAIGGGAWGLLAQGTDSTYTDDGTVNADCTQSPPDTGQSTTNSTNSIGVTVPSGQASGASGFSIYASPEGDFATACLVGSYPASDAGTEIVFDNFFFEDEIPPRVSTTLAGAKQIDPDQDILDWSWKRSVDTYADLPSGDAGDARITTDTGQIYVAPDGGAVLPADWNPVDGEVRVFGSGLPSGGVTTSQLEFAAAGSATVTASASGGRIIVTVSASGGGGGDTQIGEVSDDTGGLVTAVPAVRFRGINGASASVAASGGSAVVTIDASGLQGPAGASGASGAPGADGADGADGPTGPSGSGQITVTASGSGAVPSATEIDFASSGGIRVAVEASGASGALVTVGLPGRASGSVTTASLASGASGSAALGLTPSYRLLKVSADKACRVRVYSGSAALAADASRAIGTDPTGDHGCMLDMVIPAADLDWVLTPQVDGSNLDAISGNIPINVTNMSATGTVAVTALYLPTETA